MSLNKYMHKRNPFRNKKINFKLLSEKYPFFKDVFNNSENHEEITIDFKSPSHIAAISRALLLDTMNLDVYLPLDRLIPTIPLRMNYILWIEDLLVGCSLSKDNQVNIIDIGCGASCIYPLLGASKNNWFFKATEIDELNISVARENITKNNLSQKIEVVTVNETDRSILERCFVDGSQIQFVHAVMCNPPFFANAIDKTSALSTRNPTERDTAKSVNTSARSESLTEGGELEFTRRLIDESFTFRDKIGIFTIMLGKKCSSESVKKYLTSKEIHNYSVYEFCQGRVMRWGVAWSFLPAFKHPKSEFQLNKEQNRPPLLWNIPVNLAGVSDYSVPGIYLLLKKICSRLEIEVLEQKNKQSQGGGSHLLISAHKNTWSHQRRKRRELQHQLKKEEDKQAITDEGDEPDAKRRKLDHICEEAAALDCSSNENHSSDTISDECVLKCTINAVIVMENGFPILQLQARYLDGEREAVNQILTFFKNTLQNKNIE